MTIGTAVTCAACGAATGIRVDAVNQRCDFCGAVFIHMPTRAAVAAGEQRLRERTEAIQGELDQLDAQAVERATRGDLGGAHECVSEHVRWLGVLYEESGYNRLCGLDTGERVAQNLRSLFRMQCLRLGIPVLAVPTHNAGHNANVRAHEQMQTAIWDLDFDNAIAAYTAMCTAQVEADPRVRELPPYERKQLVTSSVRSFALGLPWATDDDFARHGIELPQLRGVYHRSSFRGRTRRPATGRLLDRHRRGRRGQPR